MSCRSQDFSLRDTRINGTHQCLVLELLGPSVPEEAQSYKGFRLPEEMAWKASKQVVQALAYIHENGVAHGGKS